MKTIKNILNKIKNLSIWKKRWVIKIIPSKPTSIFNYKVAPIHIITGLIILIIFVGSLFVTANRKVIAKNYQVKKQAAQIKELTKLLDKQNKELIEKVTKIQQENNKIRTIVGIKPKKTKRAKITSSRGRLTTAQLKERVRSLQSSIKETATEQKKLKQKAILYRKNIERQKIIKQLEATPSRWPVNSGYISSRFGWRSHPVYGGMSFHTGIDIITSYGAPIYATAAGVVSFSGYESGYGYVVKINHQNKWKTIYAHCSRLTVPKGKKVKKGQLIAYVGCSGTATGSHIHYEIKKESKLINPTAYLNTENKYFAKIADKLDALR